MTKNQLGLLATFILSSVFLFIFYGQPLRNPNTTFFASDGDGLKDYLNTMYYVKYDTTAFHSSSMNYPHGEHILFTGNQPSISFFLKFINNHIAEISQYTVGILNIIMLVSIILGAVFLYLLLRHFKLPVWYSIIAAIGITFLSPQLARLPGHFSLSYIFAIPAMLYLMAKFHEKPRYWLSVIVGLFVLWALGTHVYMLGFHASIILFFWFYMFLFTKGAVRVKSNYLHLAIQFMIPFAIFFIFTQLTDSVTDRTGYPWGFLHFRAYPESVFLPLGKPYGEFLYKFSEFGHIDWEGIAYTGLVGTIGFVVTLCVFFISLAKRRFSNILQPSNEIALNIFFWASLVALLYSFGLPFIIGDFNSLVQYIGPLKQMRGIARFSWLFFYVLNIFIFYHIWQLKERKINKVFWIALVMTSLSFLWYDAWLNVKFWSPNVNNKISELSDYNNKLEENQWIHHINISDYQATLPIPYFHIGSENVWIGSQCGIPRLTYIVTWKTGLPTMGVMLSRTSLSQTYENLELFLESYRTPAVLQKFDPNKNFLIITNDQCHEIPEKQRELIRKSTPVFQSPNFSLYSLLYDSLVAIVQNPVDKILAEFKSKELYDHNGYRSNYPETNFIINPFDPQADQEYYFVPGSHVDSYRRSEFIYHSNIPVAVPNQEFILSFWAHGVLEDLVLRSQIQLEVRDYRDWGHENLHADLFRGLKVIDDNWALIEKRFVLRDSTDMIRWRIRNPDIKQKNYLISHMMIRPVGTDIYLKGDGWIMKNNRFYTLE